MSPVKKSVKKIAKKAAKKAALKSSGMKKSVLKPGKDGVVRLAGGNPQVAKADGDAAVQDYIAKMPGWSRVVGERLDALITKNAPGVQKAVKWNSPFYGMPGMGWMVSFHVFTKYVKVTFFKGTLLTPPPGGGSAQEARWVDVYGDKPMDEKRMVAWIKQAAKIPGWGG